MIFVECQGTSHSMVFLQGTVEKLRSSDVFIMDSSNYISSLYTLWKSSTWSTFSKLHINGIALLGNSLYFQKTTHP